MSRYATALPVLVILFAIAVFAAPLTARAELPYDVVWTKLMGTIGDDRARDVAVDSNGDIYVTGYASDGMDGNLHQGSSDIFLIKYNNGGERLWTRQIGTVTLDESYCISVDQQGNVYVAGTTMGSLDENTTPGFYDIFVVKFDGNGEKNWVRQTGTPENDIAYGIATDASGSVYVVGSTNGELDGNANAGWSDIFVLKYDSYGEKQWTRQMGTGANDYAFDVEVDGIGNAYVVGKIDATTSSGDYFLCKYDSAGVMQWFKQMSSSSASSHADSARSLAMDITGNIYVCGFTSGELDGNPNAGLTDMFVVKFDSDGVRQWTRTIGSDNLDNAFSIAVDSAGSAYVSGYTRGSLDGYINAGGEDIFFAKYDTAGVKQWSIQMGTENDDSSEGVSIDDSGNVYIAGYTQGGLNGRVHNGYYDIFLMKLSALKLSSCITSPAHMATFPLGTDISVSGTSDDRTGSGISFVDVSTDCGATWNQGYDLSGVGDWSTWGFDWTMPAEGVYDLRSRATNYNADVEPERDNFTVIVGSPPPVSYITTPVEGENIALYSVCTITGTASDIGTRVGIQTVEISLDGGATWVPATGTTDWSYVWAVTTEGSYNIRTRAIDKSGIVETPRPGINVLVSEIPSNGTVWSWGFNEYGQLGDNTETDKNIPVRAIGLTDIISIAGGFANTVALRSGGTVWTAGMTVTPLIPVQVDGLTDVVAIAAGTMHMVALKSDGTVWAWGMNDHGQLGNGGTSSWNYQPAQVAGLTDVVRIATCYDHTLAVKSDGTVWSWGWGNYGVLGDGYTITRTSPVKVVGISNIIDVAAGVMHSLALQSDGTLWVWGSNAYGQLGYGTDLAYYTPIKLIGLTGVTAISAGTYHSIALKSDGTVWTFGGNQVGQIGDGTIIDRHTPVNVPGLAGVQAVAAGYGHNLALKTDGTLYSWGKNDNGQLGDGTQTERHLPVQVSSITGVSEIAAGAHHSLAVKCDPVFPESSVTYPSDGAQLASGIHTITGISSDTGSGMYRVEVSTDGGATWNVATDTSGDGAWSTWEFSWDSPADCCCNILSRATDNGGNIETPGAGVTVSVGNTHLDSLTPVVNEGGPAQLGKTIIWQAAGSGACGPYEYRFQILPEGGSWSVIRGWSSDPDWAWSPTVAGKYQVVGQVRKVGGTTPDDSINSGWYEVYDPAAPAGLSDLKPNPVTPREVNTTITWTATPSGGSGDYQFRFWVWDGSWSIKQNWSSANTYAWTPTHMGKYQVLCQVRNVGATAVQGSLTSVWYTITDSAVPPCTLGSLVPSPGSPVNVDDLVVWEAFVAEGSGSYEFRFWVYNGSSWSVGQPWSGSATFDWTPTIAGTYRIVVQARNEGASVNVEDAINSGPFYVE